MTEAEWLACDDPKEMLAFLRGGSSDRKLRLFACVAVRRVWHLIPEAIGHLAVEASEKVVDGLPHGVENLEEFRGRIDYRAFSYIDGYKTEPGPQTASAALYAAALTLPNVWHEFSDEGLRPSVEEAAWQAADAVAHHRRRGDEDLPDREAACREKAEQSALLRDIIGDPFRPPPLLAPSLLDWDGIILQLAQAAYEHRTLPSGYLDPARLAVLSDALEEAGCTDADLLTHLRSPGPHVRGCWAVDLLLAKS
jgi:hypothetical protein